MVSHRSTDQSEIPQIGHKPGALRMFGPLPPTRSPPETHSNPISRPLPHEAVVHIHAGERSHVGPERTRPLAGADIEGTPSESAACAAFQSPSLFNVGATLLEGRLCTRFKLVARPPANQQ